MVESNAASVNTSLLLILASSHGLFRSYNAFFAINFKGSYASFMPWSRSLE